MNPKKRNMLEAFEASAKDSEGEVGPPTRGAGGPFAEELALQKEATARSTAARRGAAQAPLPTPPAPQAAPGPTLSEALGSIPLLYLGLFLILLLGLTFVIGRMAAGDADSTVQAGPGGGPGGGTATELERLAEGEVDRALKNPLNTVTLRVIAYDKSDRNEAIAWVAHDYLREQRFPVARPYMTQENIFIFVGASPTTRDLEKLMKRVQELPAPDNPRAFPFSEAYMVNIEEVPDLR